MTKVFEDETKFCNPISEVMPNFVKSGCTKKTDILKYVEEIKIPENCKNLVPPLINSNWNNLYPNIQQRDRTLQEAQKILGLPIVPMIRLAEMFKTNRIDMKEAKECLSDSITLSCITFYQLNVKRRHILRPFVSKKFQPLCAASTQIEETTLFPTDATKKMKEISDASQINRQFTSHSCGYNSGHYDRGYPKNSRGRPYGRGRFPRGRFPRRGSRGSSRRGQMM